MSIDYLIAAAVIFCTAMFAWLLLPLIRYEIKLVERKRHRRRRRGYVTGDLRREIRFFDEDWHPDIGVAGASPEGDEAWERWVRKIRAPWEELRKP